MRATTSQQYQDTQVDVKLVLSALWVAMLFVFAYVDILGFYRADVLDAALGGKVATSAFAVTQAFLSLTLAYVLVPTLMVVLSLLLRPRVNRITNIVASLLYAMSVLASCIGEQSAYNVLGSIVEAALLLAITRTAWTWPAARIETSPVSSPAAAAAARRR
jgi:Family of unknown function (DUF6326)